MHLLAAQPGRISDGEEAVELIQSPGDIVVLSAADTELSALAAAWRRLDQPALGLRLANVLQLGHPLSVDLYAERVLAKAKLVVLRLLGGESYWPYGVETLRGLAADGGPQLVLLPGDDRPDPALTGQSTLPPETCERLRQFFVHGGPDNLHSALACLCDLLGRPTPWQEPRPLLRAGLYWPGAGAPDLDALRAHWRPDAPVAALVFYRALLQAATLEPVDALVAALQARGINPLPVYCTSLKEAMAADTIAHLLREAEAGLVLNATGFAVAAPGATGRPPPFDAIDAPVLQVVFGGESAEAWRAGQRGLPPRELAMNVALPEVDGRILSRAVAFKDRLREDAATETTLVSYRVLPDRVDFVAALAARWLDLRRTAPATRRMGLVLANYPNRDGRIGNGVGLDTPASAVSALRALAAAGYDVADVPADGDALVTAILDGPTNAGVAGRTVRETLPLADYKAFFAVLPAAVREAVEARWGAPADDPFFLPERAAFALPLLRCGRIAVGLQPARGYNIAPSASYHDPDLPPPHAYLAFYAWLRREVQAVVHLGKHGNLEWLPGKAVALSEDCFPDAVLGPLPHLYPFIVNDPGEGTQAKRRSQAVIVDHLTPPLTRAESYGRLRELEGLVDEYYDAAGLDPRRLALLRGEILGLARSLGLDRDCGFRPGEDEEAALARLDNHLCELKELQIRDGLHVFGRSPEGGLRTDLLVALTRLPRGDGRGGGASLIAALAADLGLADFDPLAAELGTPWTGPRPAVLDGLPCGPWRTCGDTVERLEALAQALVGGERAPLPDWTATAAVLERIDRELGPAVDRCGEAELDGLLAGLDGRFVVPGPSGAPTRGRPDVLPTGRNFYSVDNRAVPTPAAWTLGWRSACALLERHRQEEGEWPRTVALSAWGTANMRTGGDDIAQALALMGVRPTWETPSRRVTGFEVMPLSVLDRPRIDVTLRVSGFFRDAFPAQMDLFDSAVRAVAALDEPAALNPLAARVRQEQAELEAAGLDPAAAARRAGHRLFGSKPGAYGAGLQALIDEGGWTGEADFAAAYLAWGSYAYGGGAAGEAERGLFERRLGAVELVLHNQDNREHDLLDSDDYYQFEGGLAASVAALSGRQPLVYHNDHSRPERPVVRKLEEEIGRIVRGRAANPKWIAGVMRHGYKGAFEIAATVDYLFAFAATTRAVSDQHFDALFEAYLADETVRGFIAAHNAPALGEIAGRFREALDRGLWRPRGNSVHRLLQEILAP